MTQTITSPASAGDDPYQNTVVTNTIRDDAETLVMRAVNDDPPSTDDIPPPEGTSPMATLLIGLADISALAGDPLSVDLSAILREVTVSLPSMIVMRNWCERLGIANTIEQTDSLGTLVIATIGDPQVNCRIRLHCHVRLRS